jgi:hypothetical protein
MSPDTRAAADERLLRAIGDGRYADPRPALRERLRELRNTRPAAFEEARRHYDEVVAPELADSGDALATWIGYGSFVAGLNSTGRVVSMAADGGAAAYQPPPVPASLILFMPDEPAAGVLVLAAPSAPSAAQQAALDLLVNRKLSL